jgi:hypothetical protein
MIWWDILWNNIQSFRIPRYFYLIGNQCNFQNAYSDFEAHLHAKKIKNEVKRKRKYNPPLKKKYDNIR